MKLGSCESFWLLDFGEHVFGVVEPIAFLMDFFFWVAKFVPRKYDFDLCKGFFMGKNGPKFSNCGKKKLQFAIF
jgi:hypothetical protein